MFGWFKKKPVVQKGSIVGGDMAGGDIIKSQNSAVVKSGTGTSVVNRDGHIIINGVVRSLYINGKKLI